MPDHLHLLLVATTEGSDLVAFMRLFKQLSGYSFQDSTGDNWALWQKSYYDHVLRQEEDIRSVAEYIRGNPVRAGLVENAHDYPFSGSLSEDV